MSVIEGKNGPLTKSLAIVGTTLAALPIAATKVITLVFWAQTGTLKVDWLIPAELSLVAFLGGGLLLWAALRARSRRGLVAWGLGLMVGMLVSGQALAVVTGLASGASKPEGWPLYIVVASLVIFVLAMVELIIAGVLLCMDLFKGQVAAPSPPPAT